MKKILLSVLVTGAVAGVAMFATNAFFSDTETSSNNSFMAGELDLKFQVEGASAAWTDVNGSPLFDSSTIALLADMKPGDKGEKTVRLWVDDNPACGQISVNVTEDKDNSCTEPELLNDTTCVANTTLGELNDQVKFAVWADPNCNNTLDQAETILVSGPISSDKAYSIGELPVSQTTAKCYGVAYCFGNWNGTACDGSLIDNAAQSDSFKADLIINALQTRNQYPNGCPAVGETQQLLLYTETINPNAPWTPVGAAKGTLTWNGNGPTFNYSFQASQLAGSTAYKLIYAPDPWPQSLTVAPNIGKSTVIGTFTTDSSGNIALISGSTNLTYSIPAPGDTNGTGGKIWLVLSADHDGTKMTAWNPGSYLFEGNVYINYNDTDN